jgi:N-acetylglucosaminyl-diphospho-decaprenol L-rhamnosyltransferase
MKLAAIIVTYQSTDKVQLCVASLLAGSRKPDQIIIVNNGPADSQLEAIARESAAISLINSEHNSGFGSGMNLGSRQADADLLLILNPDTLVEQQTLQLLCDRIEHDDRINILAPRVIDTDGELQNSARSYPKPSTYLFNRKSLLTRLFPANRFSREYLDSAIASKELINVDWVSGCFCLVRKEPFDAIDGFDEQFFLFMEDSDLCKRMNERFANSVFYDPQPCITHEIGISNKKQSSQIELHRFRSILRYIEKHLSHYPAPLFWLMRVTAKMKIGLLQRKLKAGN